MPQRVLLRMIRLTQASDLISKLVLKGREINIMKCCYLLLQSYYHFFLNLAVKLKYLRSHKASRQSTQIRFHEQMIYLKEICRLNNPESILMVPTANCSDDAKSLQSI